MQGFFGIYFIAFKKLFTMKKTFTILVSLLATASVYSQTYNVNTFYAELGGYVKKHMVLTEWLLQCKTKE